MCFLPIDRTFYLPIMKNVKKLWLNPKIKGAFSGATSFFLTQKPKLKYKEILNQLRKVESYWKFKPANRRFKRLKYIVHFPEFLFVQILLKCKNTPNKIATDTFVFFGHVLT